MNNELMLFEGNQVEAFQIDGTIYFNPYDVGNCLELSESAVRKAISNMNERQVVKLKNSDVKKSNIRKLNNAGENFLTESGVYKLVFRSNKPNAEKFTDWVTDYVLPSIRSEGSYTIKKTEDDHPWFIKKHRGKSVITVSDFSKLIGIDISKEKLFFRPECFTPGYDWNGLGQGPLREEFELINNVHYEDDTFIYLYHPGVIKALKMLKHKISIGVMNTVISGFMHKKTSKKNLVPTIQNNEIEPLNQSNIEIHLDIQLSNGVR